MPIAKREKPRSRVIEFAVPFEIEEKASLDPTKTGEFLIRGTAINETTTRNGITYTAEELEKSAHTLRNKPILKDHNNSVDAIVGRTTERVGYDAGAKNIKFEADIKDLAVQEKIRNKLITSVSIGACVREIEECESEGSSKRIARGIDFLELSLVAVPADPNAGFAYAMAEAFKKEAKEYECPECGKKMAGAKALKKHLAMHEEDDEEESLDQETEENKEEEQMAEPTATLESLKAERQKLEMELEALKVEKLKIEKESLVTKPVIEDKTKGVVAPRASEEKEEDSAFSYVKSDYSGYGITVDLKKMPENSPLFRRS